MNAFTSSLAVETIEEAIRDIHATVPAGAQRSCAMTLLLAARVALVPTPNMGETLDHAAMAIALLQQATGRR